MKALGALRRLWSNPTALLATSVFLAGLVLGGVNLLGASRYRRFDATEDQRFSLEATTLTLLGGLREPTQVIVVESDTAPEYAELRLMLDTWTVHSRALRVQFVSEARDPAQYLEQVRDLGEGPHGSPGVIFRRNEQRAVVTGEQLRAPGPHGLERALRRGLEQLTPAGRSKVCALTGHGELNLEDTRAAAQMGNFGLDLTNISLDVGAPQAALASCERLLVVGPARPWPPAHAAAIRQHLAARGGYLLLALSPLVNDRGHLEPNGLEELLGDFGLRFDGHFVLETDPSLRLTEGMGEVFLPELLVHPLTAGLGVDASGAAPRPVVAAAGSLEAIDATRVRAFLKSSGASLRVGPNEEAGDAPRGPFLLGATAEAKLETVGPTEPAGERATHPARALVYSFTSLFDAEARATRSSRGNELLLENSFLWLKDSAGKAAELATGQVEPTSTPSETELLLTEEALQQLARYVLLEIPAASVLMGVAVVWLRRRRARSAGGPSP